MLQLSRLRRTPLSTGPAREGSSAGLPALQNCRADFQRECAKFAEQEQGQTQISGFEVALAYLVLIVLFLGMAWIAIDIF
jgi:hypothetical protein